MNQKEPEQIIHAFYNAIDNGDCQLSKSLQTRFYQYKNFKSELSNKPDTQDYCKNINSVEIFGVNKMPEKYGTNEPMYKVDLMIEFDKEITSENGNNTRFIVLTKESENLGWRIRSIGTGP